MALNLIVNASNTTNLGAVAWAQTTTNPAVGDRAIMAIAHRDVAVGTPTPSGGTGYGPWSLVAPTVTTGATFLTVWTCVMTSATPTVGTVSDSGDHQQHRMFQVHSSTVTTPFIHSVATSIETPGDTTGSAPCPNASVPNCLYVMLGSSDTPDATNTTEYSNLANGSLSSVAAIWASLGNAVATGGGSGKIGGQGTQAAAGQPTPFTYDKTTSGVKAHVVIALSETQPSLVWQPALPSAYLR